jgi:hypothetical protein
VKKPRPDIFVRSPFDRMLFGIVTLGWTRADIAEYPQRLRRHAETLPVGVVHAFQLIDGKATGLLAHVSLMIAGLGLVAPLVVDNEFEKGIVLAEIAVYLLIAVGCLRCLAVFRLHEFGDGTSRRRGIALNEVILRRELYNLCNRAAIYLTVAVFVILPFLFFYKPEH